MVRRGGMANQQDQVGDVWWETVLFVRKRWNDTRLVACGIKDGSSESVRGGGYLGRGARPGKSQSSASR